MRALPKAELKRQMKRFIADKDRGISISLFCELAGVSTIQFLGVFEYETRPLTEYIQRRVNKAYMQWKAGAVKIMKRIDNTRYVDYRKVAQPPIIHGMGLKVTSDGIKLRVGMVNRHDYSESDLNEALRG
jgi:hypothetical protein